MNEKNNINLWYDAINGIFCNRGLPKRYRWETLDDIVRVLNVVGKPQLGFIYEPNGDCGNFISAKPEEKGIVLNWEIESQKKTQKVQPIKTLAEGHFLEVALALESFEDNGAFTYLRLESDKGPYALFAKESPLKSASIIPAQMGINEFREYIDKKRTRDY